MRVLYIFNYFLSIDKEMPPPPGREWTAGAIMEGKEIGIRKKLI